jgi:hypothetical protein
LRTDTAGNIKWQTWLYDTVKQKSSPLSQGATINSLRESSRGTIICAAGDPYPNNNASPLNDYAAYLEFDSLGKLVNYNEWSTVTGYNIGGFSIEETKGKNILLAGNQAVFYLDSMGNDLWHKKYTFQLTGVGSEDNNINRVKLLRDNTPIVMGQAYEADCWTRYGKLYYDAWWSPIGYAGGLNTNWYTAGFSGEDDHLYDFTQLNNGNLVFVGSLAFSGGVQPVWIVITDSTGNRILWQKQFSGPIGGGGPMSVCATPDNGFTVVGYMDNGSFATGYDAFAAHFVSKPGAAVVSRSYSASKSVNGFSVHVSGAKLVVSGKTPGMAIGEVTLFDVSGKRVFNATSPRPSLRHCSGTTAAPLPQARGENSFTTIQFDISKLARGTYFVRVKAEAAVETMKFVYQR